MIMPVAKYSILVLILICTVSGCTKGNPFKPVPFGVQMQHKHANASPLYRKGWDDGCNTGMGTMTYSYYKSFYKFKQDVNLVDNPEYYKAWKDAYTYCRHYAFKWADWGWDFKEEW